MSLTLLLLGTPRLLENDCEIPLNRRKAMALLAYLSVTQWRHQRSSLAALLWPEYEMNAAYPALRNALWELRQTSLADLLHSDHTAVELINDGRLQVDVQHFRRLMKECPSESHAPLDVCHECVPRLEEAIGLYHGPFLSGFSASESARFDDWQFAESQSLHREYAEVLDRLTDYCLRTENWASAAQHARTWLRVDALNEPAYRKLMRALAAQGKRSEALQTFSECSRVLGAELNLLPERATGQLADNIRRSLASGRVGEQTGARKPPYTRSPIVGRREISRQIADILLGGSAQVVTLVGIGGSGKTRLALHVGRAIEGEFADGVVFVPLDSAEGETSVASATAASLGISTSRSEALKLDQVADYLRTRNILLVLDGAERHVTQVSSLLRALGTNSDVRVLLTSQTAVGISDETVIPVHGLECPDRDASLEQVRDCEAVRLLEISAKRHGTRLSLDAVELQAMARLARLLDGSPLGLQMAAGWRLMMSWDEIADQLIDNLEFLSHAHASVVPKHPTLLAVFEQSWELLPDDAQHALRGLSVFRGSFTMQAATVVTGCSPSSLATLVRRWLLKRVGPDRFEMHELLRRFASSKLNDAERDAAMARLRHSVYYSEAASEWFDTLKGPQQHQTLIRMESDISNIRRAFQFAATSGASEQLRVACLGVFLYYIRLTSFSEGQSVFANASTAYQGHADRDNTIEAFLKMATGYFLSLNDPEQATHLADDALETLPKADPHDELHAMACLIYSYVSSDKQGSSDPGGNRKRIEGSIGYYRKQGDLWGESVAVGAAANLELPYNSQLAYRYAQRRLHLCRKIEDKFGEGLALHQLARLAESRGYLELALERYRDVQQCYGPFVGESFGRINAILAQARVERQLGHLPGGIRMARQALDLSREAGYQLQIGQALLELGHVTCLSGDNSVARVHLEEAFAVLGQRKWRGLQAACARMLLKLELEEMSAPASVRWMQEAAMLEPEHEELRVLSETLAELRRHRSGAEESSGEMLDD